MQFAGFRRRFVAYVLDALPITGLVAALSYQFFGFDAVLKRYSAREPGDIDTRWEFLAARNRIRDASLVLYLTYCGVMEASALRGTLGKWVVGIEVLNSDGSPLSYAQSGKRNAVKALSLWACGLGCLWVAWSRSKQGWHDQLAGTVVVLRPVRWGSAEPHAAADRGLISE